MISKKEVKYIQSLSDKKNRDAETVFVAEGPKVVPELIASGLELKSLYTTQNKTVYAAAAHLAQEIDGADLQRISRFETANEVVAVFYQKKRPLLNMEKGWILVLDGIQDPGNMGTLIRTADWFGITTIVASEDSADCYNSKVVQSTMGSLARVDVHYTSLPPVLQSSPLPVMGALLTGKSLYQMKKAGNGVLVIGSEGKGIRADVLPFIAQPVTIPRSGRAESLNAAVATGILLSHLTE